MSKNSEKGRKGELAVCAIFSNIGTHERNIEVIRDNKTCTPERGVDLVVFCPHNTSNKLDEIAEKGDSEIGLSNTEISVRVQVKNFSGAIGKATMEEFVEDSKKNPQFAEHWGVGGLRLTKGAKEVLENANKNVPTKWYTADSITKIQAQYPERPFVNLNDETPK